MTAPWKFSLTVPIGAWHPLLESCLASLQAQQVDIEVALVDASGDPRVKELGDRFDRMLAFRYHGPDDGQAAAIVKGWQKTGGQLLGWLNADDVLFPDTLDKVRKRFMAADAPDVVYGHSTVIDDSHRLLGWQYGVEPPTERLRHTAAISQPSCFFRRDAYDAVEGLNKDLHYTMDWDLFLRLYRAGQTFAFIDEPLSQVLWAVGTKTASLTSRRRSEISRIDRLYPPSTGYRSSLRGFYVQYLIDRVPSIFREQIQRHLMRGGVPINGLAGSGRLEKAVELPLLHYNRGQATSVQVALSKRPSRDVVARFQSDQCAIEKVGRKLNITLPKPLNAGERGNLELQFDEEELYFRWLEFKGRNYTFG